MNGFLSGRCSHRRRGQGGPMGQGLSLGWRPVCGLQVGLFCLHLQGERRQAWALSPSTPSPRKEESDTTVPPAVASDPEGLKA